MEFALVARPKFVYIAKPDRPIHYRCWLLVTSTPFEYAVMAIIILNTVALTLDVYDPPKTYADVLGYLNVFFTFVFTIEMILKLIGLGPLRYFKVTKADFLGSEN